jgi:hypothetical protein
MTTAAVADAEAGFNCYIEPRTIRHDAPKRGSAEDTRAVFALVIDRDAYSGRAGKEFADPTLRVETSPGSGHDWYFLDRAISAADAQTLAVGLRAVTGADSATGKATQPYRVAGTPNFPNAKKVALGRSTCATNFANGGPLYSADELRDLIGSTSLEPAAGPSSSPFETGRTGEISPRVERILAAPVNPKTDRSAAFCAAVRTAVEDGMTAPDLEALAREHPNGCASKYLTPRDRLQQEIARLWNPHAAKVAGLDALGAQASGVALKSPAQPATTSETPLISATPYGWKDPETIARREWLYGRLLIRKFVTGTVSLGGIGKSSLITAESLAMVAGEDLLGTLPKEKLRVWLWNLEDPQEETERKIQAAALHYGLSPDDIGDRLFVDSGRDQPLVIATATRTGTLIARPVSDALVAEIIARKIDVLIIDPFVSCHEVAENDNQAMDMIVKEWGKIADRGNCAIHLVHHTPKMAGVEVTAESARGGKAFGDACRVVRAINRMSKEEGEKTGVENHRLYFRTLNDKANLQPPADSSDWFKLRSVDLGNGHLGGPGDSVGVVTTWDWPDPLAGMTGADFDRAASKIRSGKWRENAQAKDWVGKAVAEALDLNVESKPERAKVNGMIKAWLSAGSLVVVEGEDEKRMSRKFVEVREGA